MRGACPSCIATASRLRGASASWQGRGRAGQDRPGVHISALHADGCLCPCRPARGFAHRARTTRHHAAEAYILSSLLRLILRALSPTAPIMLRCVQARAQSGWHPTPAQAPFDVLMAYHQRLCAAAAAVPYSQALEFIKNRDEGERKLWADRHRAGQGSIGKVVKGLFDARELHWDVSMLPPAPPKPTHPRPARPTPANPPRAAPTSDKATFADTLKNGTRICRNWNQGCLALDRVEINSRSMAFASFSCRSHGETHRQGLL
jgi:hypothetical protein